MNRRNSSICLTDSEDRWDSDCGTAKTLRMWHRESEYVGIHWYKTKAMAAIYM